MKRKGASGILWVLAAALVAGCAGSSGDDEDVPGCDLGIASVEVPDGVYELTHSLDVSVSIRNYGPEDCASYSVTFYLSSDIFVRASEDTPIGSESRTGVLASGQTDDFPGTVSWVGAPAGSYYVGMIVTADDDANAINNAAYDTTPITINTGAVAADLYDRGDAFSDFSGTSVIPGDGWDAWCDVWNGGDANAGAFDVDFYASLDEYITTSDHFLGSVPVSSGVNFGTSVDVDLALSSFPTMPGGEFYVGWIIDAGGDVVESDEFNNTAYEVSGGKLAVIAGSDLEVTSVDVPAGTYGTTDSLWVSNSTRNNGPEVCPGYTVSFYLSDDTFIDASDILIGTSVRSGLADGQTYSTSNFVSWTDVTDGDYYVGMIVTYVEDYATSNNTDYDATAITVVTDIYEPNDTATDAYDLGAPPPDMYPYVDPRITPSNDEDWFTFNVPTSGTYYIDLYLDPPEGEDYDLYLYSGSAASPTFVESSTSGGAGGWENIFRSAVPAGNYYVLVKGKNPDDWSDETYGLYVYVYD